jgi:hypothetical protein
MTTSQRLEEKCGHGLAAWKVDGHLYHERPDQTVHIEGAKIESRALQVDACDLPAGELREARRR